MQLNSLIIYSTIDGSEIRNIKFNPSGLSLIVDETVQDQNNEKKSGSSIGKTCLVKVIDLCLGANNLKIVYSSNSGNLYDSLKEYIDKKRISAKLLIKDCYGNPIILERQLFENGRQLINGEIMSNLTTYRTRLKEIMFPNSSSLTFRKLIPFFVRYENNPVFQFLGMSTKYTQYQSIYSYLLQISQPKDIQILIDEKNSLEKINKTLLNGFKTLEDYQEQIEKEEKENNKLKKELMDFNIVSKGFSNDDENNINLQKKLDQETDYFYRLKDEEMIINEKIAKEKRDMFNDRVVLKSLFNETSAVFNNLSKSFDDLVHFHNSMCNFRIKNYEDQLERIKNERIILETNLKKLRSDYEKKFTNFKFKVNDESNSKFENYYAKKMEIKKKEENIKRYKANLEKINNIDEKLKQISLEKEKNKPQEEKIINLFNKLALNFTTKDVNLNFNYDLNKFPLILNSKEAISGEGDTKCLITALMFTIGTILSEKYDSPKFLIQDSMEQVPLISLEHIFDYARKSNFQYILPILKDRIAPLKVKENEIIMKLSHFEKLFKF